MKISSDCKSCGSTKIKYMGKSYCIFKKNNLETIIMEDESNNCIFLNEKDSVYKEILTKYRNNI
ncbi:hypothetical protein SAMN02745134_00599 [Clostridium acidisoli DSM 12555]|jgi:hypothetical protein|uniref:Uncharacterized protein n=1 Tax=Clostridium acidisoli DSM 12555 TaxID=1121291 RepID=A0A1W1X4A1_9CLOT|nr:hypothetical protein [Clostridium acidisoli]SMC18538.1 hypothetical protein SAMN02745134_00599 [Clostridium acidisoli DSM 12555]